MSLFNETEKRQGTVKIGLTRSSPEPDYSKVATINFQEGSMSEDVTDLKKGLEESGYTVEDNSQNGVLKVFREEEGGDQ